MKSMLALLLFVLSQSTVLATPVTYDFAFTGFWTCRDCATGAGDWWESQQFSGRFSGEDLDGNGAIDKSELTYFAFEGIFPNCSSGSYSCSLTEFRYAPGDIVRLRGSHAYSIWEESIYSGTSYQSFDLDQPFAEHSNELGPQRYYYYTDKTVFTITTSVPEPSAALMLAAGLGLTGLALRRRSAARP